MINTNLQNIFKDFNSNQKITLSKFQINKNKKYKESISIKPNGLWYSTSNIKSTKSWIGWTLFEKFMSKNNILQKYIYKLDIHNNLYLKYSNKIKYPLIEPKIMQIKNMKDLLNFSKKYCINKITGVTFYGINWHNLVEDGWGGIEFIPYIKLTDFDKYESILTWYTSIDTDSGCIWNNNLLKKINFTLLN